MRAVREVLEVEQSPRSLSVVPSSKKRHRNLADLEDSPARSSEPSDRKQPRTEVTVVNAPAAKPLTGWKTNSLDGLKLKAVKGLEPKEVVKGLKQKGLMPSQSGGQRRTTGVSASELELNHHKFGRKRSKTGASLPTVLVATLVNATILVKRCIKNSKYVAHVWLQG